MNPGLLSKRIQIQSQSTTPDELGQPLTSWETVYTAWAAINFKDGKQQYSAGEFVSKNTLDILVRWTSSFTFQPNQRVIYTDPTGTHTFNIESISNPDQSNKTVTLSVYELDGTA